MVKKYQPYLLPAAFVVLVLISFFLLKPFLFSALIGLIVVYVFYPFYRWLRKFIKNKTLASLVITFTVLLIIIIPSALVVNTISKEAVVIFIEGKKLLDGGSLIRQCGIGFCDYIEQKLADPQVQGYLRDALKAFSTSALEVGSRVVLSIPRIAANLLILFFVVFYGLRDSEKLKVFIKDMLRKATPKHNLLHTRFSQVMSAVLYGNILIASGQGILGALGFWIFGLTSPIAWGIVMAFFALIPYLGTAIIWVPASLLLLAHGLVFENSIFFWKALGLFLYGFIVIGSFDNILKPRIIGAHGNIHPVAILMGILGGVALMGLVGIILGPLIIAMTITLFQLYVDDKEKA